MHFVERIEDRAPLFGARLRRYLDVHLSSLKRSPRLADWL